MVERAHKTAAVGGVFLGGVGVGAGLMYLLDPDRGARRRSLLRDRAEHVITEERAVMEKGVRDLRGRARGLVARARAALRRSQPVDDEVLLERVRSQLGRCASHPRAIEVEVSEGHVCLSGPIFTSELNAILRCVRRISGVRGVESQLDLHDSGEHVVALQGVPRPRARPALLRETWPPYLRLLGASAGLIAVGAGLERGGPRGIGLAAGGGALLLRSLVGTPIARLLGLRAGHISVSKTITVVAPLEEVYAFFSRLENLPRFMEHVREVQVHDHRSHWVVEGPAGVQMSWDAEITQQIPPRRIAWRTLPGSTVGHTGTINFESISESVTRLTVRMTYDPPGGAIGHAVAELFGRDPKRSMDEDLLRLKSLLEEGKTHAGGTTITTQP